MTAAVYGRHSLDELQQLVVEAFSPVVNKQLPVPAFSPDVVCDEVGAAARVGNTVFVRAVLCFSLFNLFVHMNTSSYVSRATRCRTCTVGKCALFRRRSCLLPEKID